MNRAADSGGRQAVAAELLRPLAQFADLPLSEERFSALEEGFATAIGEHAALRALPLELEAHMVFDPRWD